MLYGILLAILILDGIFLCVGVLRPAGMGGGLAARGGGASATDGGRGGRQATTMLTRATWTTGSVFMLLALVLSIMSSRAELPQSILRQDPVSTAPVAQPILPLLDQTGDAGDGSGEPNEAPAGGDGND